MKKLYFLLIALILFTTTKAQIVTIPDAKFKAELLRASSSNQIAQDLTQNFIKIDSNSDGEIQQSEALQVVYLKLDSSSITSLIGIKSFINLKELDCFYNSLPSLDVSGLTNLTSLNCRGNFIPLESLNVSGLTNLKSLDCSDNQLTSLDVSGLTNLTSLSCGRNLLPTLNVSGLTNLKSLDCSDNQLPSLDVSGLTNLTSLSCGRNLLPTLNVSGLTNLRDLSCSNNLLPSLNVSGLTNLRELSCGNNLLPLLNVSSLVNLEYLHCYNNLLPSLDIGGLINLKSLYCSNNLLPSLDIGGLINLYSLYCDNNLLPSLDVSGLVNLETLNCNNNLLQSLNVSGLINLRDLNCSNNLLPSLNVTGLTNLWDLNCSNNLLTSLNVSGLTNLQDLSCSNNLLPSLNVSGLTNLRDLSCSNNLLPSLNVSGLTNLRDLSCSNNLLTSLDISGLTNLFDLDCSSNQLTNLDLSGKTRLYHLDCSSNQLVDLILKDLRGVRVDCSNNMFTQLDFSDAKGIYLFCINSPNLTNINLKNNNQDYISISGNINLKYICADVNEIGSFQRDIDYFDNDININSYCSFTPGGDFYTIQGNQKLDSNNNGCDALDVIIPNLKFTITDGTTTGSLISDASGDYSIPVQAGTHTITPVFENSTYFTISPISKKVVFPTQSSPFTQNFCIKPNGVHPDLEITLLPLQPARPGFDAEYKIIYKNKGNTTQSVSVNLTFDDAVLDFVVANPAATTQTTNDLSWDFTNLLPFETREITFTLNVNSPMEIPAVNDGAILPFYATIMSEANDETPADNIFVLNQNVVNSFDPNDKTCLEGSVITPALIGQYVHYMIRFENKGTFAAENVVVKDMIDLSKFDISTLVPTTASHSYTTKISEGNKVEFIFENINLPFDDENNDGYIAFKIKTKPTLVVNNTFANEANIYFDYNFPILTNKATSTFKALGTEDFEFSNYFTLYPNPAKAVLNISTKQSINVKSISVYNTLGQLVLVVTHPDKVSKIDVSSLTTGNYFIKINSDKGSSNARFVKE